MHYICKVYQPGYPSSTNFSSSFNTKNNCMNAFLSLGRYFFVIPFAVFGLFHLMKADTMASMVPSYMPAAVIWVYLSGLGLIAAAVSILLGKYDKLAATLLSVMLLLFAIMIYLPGAMSGGETAQSSLGYLLRDLSHAGAAMLYAANLAKDRSIIG